MMKLLFELIVKLYIIIEWKFSYLLRLIQSIIFIIR
jgi:hypothetical protein